MATIFVEGLGNVDIQGDTPTEEEQQSIIHAIGNPSIVPESYYNDPKMKLQGTPYAWWADNRVEKIVN